MAGEHGIGLLKRDGMRPEMHPGTLAMQAAVKAALDPLDLFNPGKIFGDPSDGRGMASWDAFGRSAAPAANGRPTRARPLDFRDTEVIVRLANKEGNDVTDHPMPPNGATPADPRAGAARLAATSCPTSSTVAWPPPTRRCRTSYPGDTPTASRCTPSTCRPTGSAPT